MPDAVDEIRQLGSRSERPHDLDTFMRTMHDMVNAYDAVRILEEK
jgi:hypothetical protein